MANEKRTLLPFESIFDTLLDYLSSEQKNHLLQNPAKWGDLIFLTHKLRKQQSHHSMQVEMGKPLKLKITDSSQWSLQNPNEKLGFQEIIEYVDRIRALSEGEHTFPIENNTRYGESTTNISLTDILRLVESYAYKIPEIERIQSRPFAEDPVLPSTYRNKIRIYKADLGELAASRHDDGEIHEAIEFLTKLENFYDERVRSLVSKVDDHGNHVEVEEFLLVPTKAKHTHIQQFIKIGTVLNAFKDGANERLAHALKKLDLTQVDINTLIRENDVLFNAIKTQYQKEHIATQPRLESNVEQETIKQYTPVNRIKNYNPHAELPVVKFTDIATHPDKVDTSVYARKYKDLLDKIFAEAEKNNQVESKKLSPTTFEFLRALRDFADSNSLRVIESDSRKFAFQYQKGVNPDLSRILSRDYQNHIEALKSYSTGQGIVNDSEIDKFKEATLELCFSFANTKNDIERQ